eukprot:1635266-Karenia_brevis.AAC.1
MSSSREAMRPHLQRTVNASQFGGGCNTGSTAVAHLQARAQVDYGLANGKSVIQLFVDVCTAFAAMARALAVPCECTDGAFFEKL